MYKELFNDEKQNAMRSFFLKSLAPLGMERSCRKNDIIDIPLESYVAIVTTGRLKVTLNNSRGAEKVLYFLSAGEIFGETSYFAEGKFNTIVIASEASVISIVNEESLNKFLEKNPEAYRFFIHSMMRKYNISISQMSDILFNPSNVKIASTLYRLAVQGSRNIGGRYVLNMSFTHQELADLIGCSRITVTRILNDFKAEKIIDVIDKKIVIEDIDRLKEQVQF